MKGWARLILYLSNQQSLNVSNQADSRQVFMPSAQDHVNVKPGGLGEAVLGNRLQVVEFPNMRHGWTTREDSHVMFAKL